jgi:hypothetical protein
MISGHLDTKVSSIESQWKLQPIPTRRGAVQNRRYLTNRGKGDNFEAIKEIAEMTVRFSTSKTFHYYLITTLESGDNRRYFLSDLAVRSG